MSFEYVFLSFGKFYIILKLYVCQFSVVLMKMGPRWYSTTYKHMME
jgi:hypothetical protein